MNLAGMAKLVGIGGIGGVLGFLISQAVTLSTFNVNLETTKRIAMVVLARELGRDFYSGVDPGFRQIRTAIERCDKLYKSWGGKLDHDQINRYLGFFDDVGYYYRIGAVDLQMVDHMFGAHIVEAYEYNELRRYIEDLRKNTKQRHALVDFELLAKRLEEIPGRYEATEVARRGCFQKTG